jgi:hypothetical protein
MAPLVRRRVQQIGSDRRESGHCSAVTNRSNRTNSVGLHPIICCDARVVGNNLAGRYQHLVAATFPLLTNR